jgi:hypothetical protein
MANRSPIIRFGIGVDGKRSGYWRVRAGVARPELFLEREGQGGQWHLSLHESGRWQMKFGQEERVSWARPDEFVPGYTRAAGIVQPASVAFTDDAPGRTRQSRVRCPGLGPTTFSIFFERPGATWTAGPARNAMGTLLVGTLPWPEVPERAPSWLIKSLCRLATRPSSRPVKRDLRRCGSTQRPGRCL